MSRPGSGDFSLIWDRPGCFCGSYGFGNDSCEMYNGQQRFMLYCFHIKDPVYFGSSFRMTMDNLGWTGPRYDYYASVAFWYQQEISALPGNLPKDSERVIQ